MIQITKKDLESVLDKKLKEQDARFDKRFTALEAKFENKLDQTKQALEQKIEQEVGDLAAMSVRHIKAALHVV